MNIALAYAVHWFGNLFVAVLMIRVLMTWLPFDRNGFVGKIHFLLTAFTEPIVYPFRWLVQRSPLGGGMIDFSPMLAFLAVRLVTINLSNFLLSL